MRLPPISTSPYRADSCWPWSSGQSSSCSSASSTSVFSSSGVRIGLPLRAGRSRRSAPSPRRRTPPAGRRPARATSQPSSFSRSSSSAIDLLVAGSCRHLLRDRPQDPVHEPARVLGRVALRQRDRLVDRHLERDRPFFAARRRRSGGCSAPASPSCSAGQSPETAEMRASSSSARRGDRLGEPARELVDLALVVVPRGWAGEIPLVEQEQRRAPRCALRDNMFVQVARVL